MIEMEMTVVNSSTEITNSNIIMNNLMPKTFSIFYLEGNNFKGDKHKDSKDNSSNSSITSNNNSNNKTNQDKEKTALLD